MLSSAARSVGGRFGPKGWPVYSERPAGLLRKPGFFTPKYAVTEDKAKSTLFDLVYNPQIPIFLINPEPAHKTWARREYFDIDLLVANIVNTALKHRMPGFDTIHAHTIFTVGERIIAVSKDTHFQRFKNIKNVVDVVTATDFLKNYDIK